MSTDLAATIAPKSDQLNADDLIAGPITITITGVKVSPGDEQPASIHFEGDNGKPFKACKSMRRLLVMLWGANGAAYKGRRLTLYRDPSVRFGSDEVGGIRISHMSHIDGPKTVALTATRGRRKPYTVKPLATQTPPDDGPESPHAIPVKDDMDEADWKAWAKAYRGAIARASPATLPEWKRLNADNLLRLTAASPALRGWIAEAEKGEAA